MRIHPIDAQMMVRKYAGVRKVEETPGFSLQVNDGIELSEEALTYANAVKEVRASLAETSSEDALRIRNLAKQIQNGTYQVDASAIVEKMLGGA